MRCMDCNAEMKKIYVPFRGVNLEASECPDCKEQIFTEELAKKAAKRLDETYVAHPIRIGRRWGLLLPDKLAKTLKFDNKTELEVHTMRSGIGLKRI